MATYTIHARDARSLTLRGIFATYDALSWTRRPDEAGSFKLQVPLSGVSDATMLAKYTVIDVWRDGVPEFSGVVTRREYDAAEET